VENIKPFKNYFSTSEIWLSDRKQSFTREDFETMVTIYNQETNNSLNLSFNENDLRMLLDYFSKK